ncbi:MAG: alanine racemase C-terminal domain-containing protein, partial [Planctomycetota bacterium]
SLDLQGLDPAPVRGDFVELIGPNLTLEAVGQSAGTIGYEILTALGRRYHRVYLEADSASDDASGSAS